MARKSTVDEKEALERVYTAALAKIASGQLTTNAAFLAYKSEGVKRQTLYDRVAGALPRNKAQTARQLLDPTQVHVDDDINKDISQILANHSHAGMSFVGNSIALMGQLSRDDGAAS